MAKYPYIPLNDNVEEMFIGPFGSSLKNDAFVEEDEAYCMVYEQKHAIKKTMDVDTRYVNRKKYEELKRFNIKGGDIIVSCRGTIGETYIVPEGAPLGIMHPSIMKIRLKPGVYNKQYFNLLLRNYLKRHEDEANGSGIKMAISAKELGTELFPVPNMSEQNQIALTFAQVDELIALRKEQLAQLDQLIISRFIEMFGDPVYNNNGLPTKKLCELGSLDRGRSQHRPRNDQKLLNGPYPLIQTGEVASAGLYITEYKNTYSELGLQQSKMWKAGTLCITIAANIAQTAILTFDACFPDSVVGFVPDDAVSAIYMHYWFGFFQKILEEQAPQVAQKNINLKILSDLDVMVPPHEKQAQFATFVEQTDKLKFEVKKGLDKLKTLKKSLMQQYFG